MGLMARWRRWLAAAVMAGLAVAVYRHRAEDEVELIKRVVETATPQGILREAMQLGIERQYALPWSVAKGLGAARTRTERASR